MLLVGMIGISYIFSFMGRIARENNRQLGLVSAAETNIVNFSLSTQDKKIQRQSVFIVL